MLCLVGKIYVGILVDRVYRVTDGLIGWLIMNKGVSDQGGGV